MNLLYVYLFTIIFILKDTKINGASFFDSNGHLSQVDSALKAATNGGNILAIKNISKNKIIAVLWSPIEPGIDVDYNNNNYNNNIQKLSDKLFFCGAGVAADVTFLCNRVFDEVLSHRHLFGSECMIDRLAATIASYMHESTLSMRHRPFGARILFLGLDESSSSRPGARLLELDPIGNCHDCILSCIGPYTEHIMKAINGDNNDNYRKNNLKTQKKVGIRVKGIDILDILPSLYKNDDKDINHEDNIDFEDEIRLVGIVLDVMEEQGLDVDEVKKQITVVRVDEKSAGPISNNNLHRIFQKIALKRKSE